MLAGSPSGRLRHHSTNPSTRSAAGSTPNVALARNPPRLWLAEGGIGASWGQVATATSGTSKRSNGGQDAAQVSRGAPFSTCSCSPTKQTKSNIASFICKSTPLRGRTRALLARIGSNFGQVILDTRHKGSPVLGAKPQTLSTGVTCAPARPGQ